MGDIKPYLKCPLLRKPKHNALFTHKQKLNQQRRSVVSLGDNHRHTIPALVAGKRPLLEDFLIGGQTRTKGES